MAPLVKLMDWLPPLSAALWGVLFLVGTVPLAGFRGEVTGWRVKASAGSCSGRYPELHLCLLQPLHPHLCQRRSRVGVKGAQASQCW